MEKQITPQIIEILRRDANDNLTEGQRNYLLSEQGWTLEDYEESKEYIIDKMYGVHKGRTMKLLSFYVLLFTIGLLVNIFIVFVMGMGK
jgi:hypothetical protein